MSKQEVSKLQGTPTHLETLHKKENDPRRDKRTCRYFNKEKGSCFAGYGKCIGSSHCSYYKRWTKEEFDAIKQLKRNKTDKVIVDTNKIKAIKSSITTKKIIKKTSVLKPAVIPNIPPNPFASTTNGVNQVNKQLTIIPVIKTQIGSEKSKSENTSVTRIKYGRLEYLGKSYTKGSVIWNQASEKGSIEYFYKSAKGRVCVRIKYSKRSQEYRWKTLCSECGLAINGTPTIVESSKI